MTTAEIIAVRNWLRDQERERNRPRHREADRLRVLGDGAQGGECCPCTTPHHADEYGWTFTFSRNLSSFLYYTKSNTNDGVATAGQLIPGVGALPVL